MSKPKTAAAWHNAYAKTFTSPAALAQALRELAGQIADLGAAPIMPTSLNISIHVSNPRDGGQVDERMACVDLLGSAFGYTAALASNVYGDGKVLYGTNTEALRAVSVLTSVPATPVDPELTEPTAPVEHYEVRVLTGGVGASALCKCGDWFKADDADAASSALTAHATRVPVTA